MKKTLIPQSYYDALYEAYKAMEQDIVKAAKEHRPSYRGFKSIIVPFNFIHDTGMSVAQAWYSYEEARVVKIESMYASGAMATMPIAIKKSYQFPAPVRVKCDIGIKSYRYDHNVITLLDGQTLDIKNFLN